jgi:predicted porin
VATGKATDEVPGSELEQTMHQISANWDNRAFGIYGNWYTVEEEETGFQDVEVSGFGLSFVARFAGRHELYLMGYQNEVDDLDLKSRTLALGYQHVLSKRTRIYTAIAKTKNDDNGIVGLIDKPTAMVPTPAGGYDPRGFQIGIVHTF